MSYRTRLRGIAAGLALAFSVGSCQPEKTAPTPPAGGQSVMMTKETFVPDRLPYEKASLILAGTTYAVGVRREERPDGIQFLLVKGDEVLDRETYVLDDDAFRIRLAAGVQYEPPIPLIEFGKRIGDEWGWQGHVLMGAERLSAAAAVSTAEEDINLAGAFDRGLRVRAILEIDGPASDHKLQRALTFWFAPRRGLVKREFGTTSTRMPAP